MGTNRQGTKHQARLNQPMRQEYPNPTVSAIDPPLLSFFAEALAALGASGTDLLKRRERYDRLGDLAGRPDAPGVERSDLDIRSPAGHRIVLRRYLPPGQTTHAGPIAIYLHGGGWNAGSIVSHDPLCAWLTHELGLELISVEYRLSPEHPHPAALDDAIATVRWCAQQNRRLVLLGDSAGGHLAVAAALNEPLARICCVGVLYPAFSPRINVQSHTEHAESPGLSLRVLNQSWDWLGGPAGRSNLAPYYDLMRVADWSRFPATVAVGAQIDPLRDEASLFASILSNAGNTVRYRCAVAMPHGFARLLARSELARREMRWFVSAVQQTIALQP